MKIFFSVDLHCAVSQQQIHLNGDHRNFYKTCVITNANLTNPSDLITISGVNYGDTDMVGVQFEKSKVKFLPKGFKA